MAVDHNKMMLPKQVKFTASDGHEVEFSTFRNSEVRTESRNLAEYLSSESGIDPEAYPFHHLPPHTPLEVSRYRRSDLIKWPLRGGTGQPAGVAVDRNSMTQSRKSRNRCAFSFLNAERNFEEMLLLSWPGVMRDTLTYDDVKSSRKRFLDRIRRKIPDIGYGWFLEFGGINMNPHMHLFTTDLGSQWRTVDRGGGEVEVATEESVRWIVEAWQGSAGIENQKSTLFNKGYRDKNTGSVYLSDIQDLIAVDIPGVTVEDNLGKMAIRNLPSNVSEWVYGGYGDETGVPDDISACSVCC